MNGLLRLSELVSLSASLFRATLPNRNHRRDSSPAIRENNLGWLTGLVSDTRPGHTLDGWRFRRVKTRLP